MGSHPGFSYPTPKIAAQRGCCPMLNYKEQKIYVNYFPETRKMWIENNELHMHETIYKPIRSRKYMLIIFQRLDRCGEKTMKNTSG
jgi:Leu/Phe-tRNA-protein transferase